MRNIGLDFFQGRSGFRSSKQLLQLPILLICFQLLTKRVVKLCLNLPVGVARTPVGWPAQIRGQQQSDEDEHPADSGDDVRKSEEADSGIKRSEPFAHDLASVAIGADTGCWRSTKRNFETMCE